MISFDGVTCVRGGREVLSSVSFQVDAGECIALVGRSGAGKSSILKLINGMLRPLRGRVYVKGLDTTDWDPVELRRQTGYVLQEVGLFPHMTVRQNVTVVPKLLGWTPDRMARRADELLALVGLPPDDFADRWPDQLSGGQRQRVGVARALAAEPLIVLMDEPFGALDPITRSELHVEFKRIRQQVGKTIVLVTHDLREAVSLADRVGVLDSGRLVAIGRIRDLWDSCDAAVQALLQSAELEIPT